jgi:hypothetical protein
MKQEIVREVEIDRRTDHWLSAGGRVTLAGGGFMSPHGFYEASCTSGVTNLGA